VRILFANPIDVAYADQAASSIPGTVVRLRGLVPSGRMYVIRDSDAAELRFGFELDQRAEEVIVVATSTPPGAR
jgi:hypothetical protein